MAANFVSLHNHTEYSFLDGAIKIDELVEKTKEFGMSAVAITDHGGLFGAVEFFTKCKKAGIKPILGFEAYVAPGSRHDKKQSTDERNYCHLILLAKNKTGWKNLMRLSTIGYLEGFYYKPRIDNEVLRQYSDGIIATSACVAGAIPQAILSGDIARARKLTEEYISIFGKENFYFELQDHGIDDEKTAMKGLIALGREMGVPFIVANDAHYLLREHAASHEILLCIGTQDTLDNPKHYRFTSDQVYFKSPQEMAKLFPDIPEAMSNTLEIAERCEVDIEEEPQLPSVSVPSGFENPEEYLSHLARNGLRERYENVTPELESRLEYELGVINSMKFAGYFLIVQDIVRKAKETGVMVGCRGSAAGSLVVYAIGITDVDPIKYDLIFERFLNPERISMPDADIDIADRDRYMLIDYVVEKYGRDAVCQIINFGSMKAKMAVKDVARVNGFSVAEINNLSKMITENTLAESFGLVDADGKPRKDIPPIAELIDKNGFEKYQHGTNQLTAAVMGNSAYKNVFRHASVIEGLTRQPGMHAAGVIVAPGEVVNWAPLFKAANSEDATTTIMTQFDMNYVEKVGLIKMDFLGLRTLTVLQDARRLVKKYHGIDLDLWKLPDGDQKTLELFGNGETTGIFQFESPPMRDYLRKLKPTGIEDLIAMNALYRPGPMGNINMFIDRKHGREKIEYRHPCLEEILSVTYGVIVYQEQVMRITQAMGNFTLGKADTLRKAMSKKDVANMEKLGVEFIDGAVSQGIDMNVAKEVCDLIMKFGGYGFNKAHSAVYAHLAYQTAYIKAYYPLEYMTAYLGAYLGNMDEFLKIRNEAERTGIRLLPPDVNKSDYDFGIDGGNILIGLAAVKNVGKAAESILNARQEGGAFSSIFDLCKRTDNRIVNKKALESLIYAGALDCFGGSRAQHIAAVANALEYGSACQKDLASGQGNLFDTLLGTPDADALSTVEPKLPSGAEWPLNIKLQYEKEILGFYTSGHPLDQYKDDIAAFATTDIASEEFKNIKDGEQVTIGGLITAVDLRVIKSGRNAGKTMGIYELESFDASIKMIAYSEKYEKLKDMLIKDAMILARGKIRRENMETMPELQVEGCIHLSQVRVEMAKSVHITVSTNGLCAQSLDSIRKCCGEFPGDCYLIMHVTTADNNVYKIRAGSVSMSSANEALNKLRALVGDENVRIAKTAN
ncbi:DNA polymerase III subunit alpha [Fibrobacteres bacterium R8-0-B4]